MPRRPLISARLPDDLAALVAAKMGSTGLSQSQAVIEALRLWVGLPVAAPNDRLAGIERRLSALEQGSTRSTVVYPPKPPKQTVAAPIESTGFTGSTGFAEADGGRWLTTQQGYATATRRGYQGSATAWRSWSKRNPGDCLSRYQLRYIPHGSRSNTVASFEDVGRG